MREIGGYIELDRANGEEYHKDAVAVNSGRHAVEYIIRAKNIKKMYIPYFLCASIRNLCEKCGCEYEFYNINPDFTPEFSKHLTEDEYLYIVNYYGQIKNDRVQEYKKRYANIIFDNAQAFFEEPVLGVDTIYTCRKFFGVSDGGYVYTDALLSEELTKDISYDRIRYILGRFEVDAGTFYKESADNNKLFATEDLKTMSKLTQNLLRCLDYRDIKNKRKANFAYLHDKLKGYNKLNLTIPNGAFMYPLYVDNGAKLKEKLIENKIFVPTLWADTFEVADKASTEWNYAQNIVPLPVDQRYDENDMEYILSILKEVL